MRFEALQARYGDCLFLTFNDAGTKRRLLVDGGPSRVFKTFLEPRLKLERKDLGPGEELTIDVVMISHIDEDHILGILDLFGMLLDRQQDSKPWPYRPTWLLHNSLDTLAGESEGGIGRSAGGDTVLASLGGDLLSSAADGHDGVATKVLASYRQGSKLNSLAGALNIASNPPEKAAIMLDSTGPRVLHLGAASMTVVGPMQAEVEALRKEWAAWKAAEDKKAGAAALAAYLDTSAPNLSSMVVLIEHGGHTVLLTGDARGDKILDGLKMAGNLRSSPLVVDILKLPHHGSAHNMAEGFFKAVHARHYVASGDGTYGNPDRETLLMLEHARPRDKFTLHLTYDAASCDAVHEKWLSGRKEGPFDPARHAIADVVARWRNEGRITVKEGPVVIDL